METILPVIDMADKTGTQTVTVTGHELVILNRSANSMTLEVSSLSGKSITIPLGHTLSEKYLKFTSFVITATDPADEWSYLVRG